MAGNAPELQKIGGVFTFSTNIITNAEKARFKAVFQRFFLLQILYRY